jgi:hypothetical protein
MVPSIRALKAVVAVLLFASSTDGFAPTISSSTALQSAAVAARPAATALQPSRVRARSTSAAIAASAASPVQQRRLVSSRKSIGHKLSTQLYSRRVSTIADANNDMMQQLREGLPYLTAREVSELQRALAVALRVHTDAAGTREAKKRVEHSVRVCLILGELDMDVDALLATVLAGTITPAEGPLGYVTSHIF